MAAVCVPRKGRFTPHGGVKSWYYPAAKTALGSDRCGISWLETNSGGTCWVPPYSCLPSCVHRSAPSLPCTASFLLRSQIAPSHRVSGLRNESCNPGRAPASSTLVARLPTQASTSIAMRTERSPELICLRVTLGSACPSASLSAAKWGSANLLGREWTAGARVDGWGPNLDGGAKNQALQRTSDGWGSNLETVRAMTTVKDRDDLPLLLSVQGQRRAENHGVPRMPATIEWEGKSVSRYLWGFGRSGYILRA
jgi:hypothetical protein